MGIFSWLVVVVAFLSTLILAAQESIALGSLLIAPALWLVIIGSLTAVITEGLSLFHLLGHAGIMTCWVVVISVIGIRISRGIKSGLSQHIRLPSFRIWSRFQKLAFVGVLIILSATLLCALLGAPNNYDSMTYHNARVMQWLDHGSLENYFTPIDRQIRMPPLASYFRLHLMAMLGNDSLFNSVQWIFFVVCILINSLWAWTLAAEPAALVIAGVFTATLPMAILQSSSTQNDLVVAGYLLSAGFLGTQLLQASTEDKKRKILILFWTCIGLGFLAKGTSYVYGTVLGVFVTSILLVHPKRPSGKSVVTMTSIGLVIVVLLNGPFLRRNATFNGPNAGAAVVVSTHTWATSPISLSAKRVVSQFARAAGQQYTAFNQTRQTRGFLKQGVKSFHEVLHLPINDEEIGRDDHFQAFDANYLTHEDYAGNPIHFFLAFFLLVLVFLVPRLRKNTEVTTFFFCAFCIWAAAAIEIKFMAYNSRLLMPPLLFFAAPVAITLTQFISSKRAQTWLVAGLLVSSLPFLLFNHLKPIFTLNRLGYSSMFNQTRWDNYFRSAGSLQSSIEHVISEIPKECSRTNPVGLIFTWDSWEYPFWIGAARANKDVSFRHIPADASKSGLCSVITTNCADGSAYCLLR